MKRQLTILITFFILILLCSIGKTQDCTTNCVWPGDANTNGISNNLDVLSIGLGFGTTGPIRNMVAPDPWEPQTSEDWPQSLPVSGTNYKHLDANGDGIIDEIDATTITQNFNMTNDSFTVLGGQTLVGNDLFIEFEQTEVAPGQTVKAFIHCGTAENPIEGLYGIAFSLEVDTSVIEFATPPSYPDSWLGASSEVLGFEKVDLPTWNQMYMALVRTDGTSRTGSGIIAEVNIVIADVIIPLIQDSTSTIPFPIKFKNVLAINEFEESIPIGVRNDSIVIRHESFLSSNSKIAKNRAFNLFPNPTSNQFYIDSDNPISNLKIISSLGELILWQPQIVLTPFHFNLNQLAAGVYFVTAEISGYKMQKKLIIN